MAVHTYANVQYQGVKFPDDKPQYITGRNEQNFQHQDCVFVLRWVVHVYSY